MEKENNVKTTVSKENSMQTVETFCPIFSGFYGSWYDNDIDYAITMELEDNINLNEEDIEFDYKSYFEEVAECNVDVIKDILNENVVGLIEDMKYQKLVSPREYNFANDSINVEIKINTDVLSSFIKEHRTMIADKINNKYTSRSGFTSWYSDDIDVWEEETKGWSDFTDNEHYLGSLLDMIAECNDISEYDVYSIVSETISAPYEYVTINAE